MRLGLLRCANRYLEGTEQLDKEYEAGSKEPVFVFTVMSDEITEVTCQDLRGRFTHAQTSRGVAYSLDAGCLMGLPVVRSIAPGPETAAGGLRRGFYSMGAKSHS